MTQAKNLAEQTQEPIEPFYISTEWREVFLLTENYRTYQILSGDECHKTIIKNTYNDETICTFYSISKYEAMEVVFAIKMKL